MANGGRLIVSGLSRQSSRGVVRLGPVTAACALGRAGRQARKREGDGATPLGCFRMLRVLYRADRVQRPRTALPVRPLRPGDGWCDAPGDRNYNRCVRLPYPASAEQMWRQDRLYDLIVVLDQNARPRVRGHGSAIFVHVARPGFQPTEGCVALELRALQRLIGCLGRGATIMVR